MDLMHPHGVYGSVFGTLYARLLVDLACRDAGLLVYVLEWSMRSYIYLFSVFLYIPLEFQPSILFLSHHTSTSFP